MRILDEDVARVRAEADFVAIASELMSLRQSGTRWVGLCPFHAEKTPSFSIEPVEGLWYCLAGETRVITDTGVFPIQELAGATHRILTQKGAWVDAPFFSFGQQRLSKIVLSRNGQTKEIRATAEHRWFIRVGDERTGRREERTTAQLKKGHRLATSFAQNSVRGLRSLSAFGISHGIVYGDGHRFGPAVAIDLYGEKNAQLLKWFPLSPTYEDRHTATGLSYTRVLDLPHAFRERPKLTEARSYLAGWLAGYVAADGHVARDGTVSLNSANRSDLEFVRDVCTRLGIGTYGITEQVRAGIAGRAPSSLFRVHFINEDLDERFFLIDEHRIRFTASHKRFVRRGWVVKNVEETDEVEEVFCAVVDRTHSFTLEDNILTGNCFGCSAGGDLISFVQGVQHVDFVAAVESLAGRLGIELRYDDAAGGEDRKRRSQLQAAVTAAAAFFHDQLLSSDDAAKARGYLRSRGFDGDVARQFQLGFAPDGFDTLARALALPDDVFTKAGLGFMNRAGRQQDAFRGRLMFPIFDAAGQAVGFGGRRLEGVTGEQDTAKYKNTAESELYSKRRTLYGLNWAKPQIVEVDEVVICEGYTDVLACHLAGIDRAVATCGTAVTEEHLRLLAKFTKRIVLAYDADSAGQAAAERFFEWEDKLGLDLAVAALPAGKDPGDLAKDTDTLVRAVELARPFLSFRIDRALASADLSSAEGKARAVDVALGLVADHPNELVRSQYIVDVADRCGVPEADVRRRAATKQRGTTTRQASTPAQARSVDGPEIEALRLFVRRREQMRPMLDEILFASDLHRAAYRALADTTTARDAAEAADPAAADLIRRITVEDSDAEPGDVAARLIDLAAQRNLDQLRSTSRTAEDPTQWSQAITWVARTRDQLRAGDTEAQQLLLDWLIVDAADGSDTA